MNAFLRRYLALTTKEVQQLRRNRGLVIQLLIPPTIVLIIFGYALNPKVRHLRLGIVDESHTTQSRDFINSLSENVTFDVTRHFLRTEEAEHALDHLKLDLFVVIPTGFARSLGRGQTADVQVVIDAVDANTAQIAQGYLERALIDYNAANGRDPAATPGAVQVRSAYLYNPGLDTSWFYVTGIMSILMFINASLVASALAVKRRRLARLNNY